MKRALLVRGDLACGPAPRGAGPRPRLPRPHRVAAAPLRSGGLEDLDRPTRGVRGVPADGAHRARGEGPDRRDQARAGLLRAGGPRGERRGQAPADGPALGLLGGATSRRSPRTRSTASSASTWCRRPSSGGWAATSPRSQLWVEGCKHVKDVDQSACPRPIEWAKQVCRQKVFDNLIANIDRNAGNLLVDGEWNLVLIDHSRAFASDRMPFEKEMTRIDRELFARLKALDEAALMKHVRPWVLGDGDGPRHPQAARQDRRPLREARPGAGRGRRLPVLR